MAKYKKPRCMQPKATYTFDYPDMLKFESMQIDNFWHPNEPKVEKDLHQLKTELTPTEFHGVITTLKLFTLYELIVGKEYWLGRFSRMFPRPEFQRVASINGMTELNIHAPFYNKVNEILRLNTDEFYASYVDDAALKERMDFIDKLVSVKGGLKEDLVSLAIFSLIEGAILYSSFAFLSHFQSNGKNRLGAIVSGISFSTRDENCHHLAGAAAFQLAIKESKEEGLLTDDDIADIYKQVQEAGLVLGEHEDRIIDMIFEKGSIDGVTKVSLGNFVKSRIDLCLDNQGISKIYHIKYNPIAKWFYQNISMPTLHDFFVNTGSQYNRNWSEQAFVVPSGLKFVG